MGSEMCIRDRKTPVAYTPTDTPRRRRLKARSRMHAAACSGSTGQGAFLACHCMKADKPNNRPDAIKSGPLFADSHMMPGNVAVRPAITAPAPTVIKRAGNAQQSKVDVLANSDNVGPISVRRSMGFTRPLPHYLDGWLRCGNRPAWQASQFACQKDPNHR